MDWKILCQLRKIARDHEAANARHSGCSGERRRRDFVHLVFHEGLNVPSYLLSRLFKPNLVSLLSASSDGVIQCLPCDAGTLVCDNVHINTSRAFSEDSINPSDLSAVYK
ncbi:hypothetical protein MPTK1_1g01720 [Marchantia polymorpha subsp. ruderalis]|uniref:Uncharacterized protein n=2 Tax=Marchantia polymorpha TaxID=3197 RepID=A0AAF6AKG8_MARPO|nr:hypothetical protein MARPO_0029s0073 [Marchantia polymorpha]BBM96938.1 hypothetical protein Mp_1g01720 [Marchantia polymorpha subsp. ruderalis]|eukprot:PTQ42543.1 hypothetical protein MARPO_0029s0073 [Marchantia polymorpha]